MGEKEQGAATAREAGSGMATGRVFPETNVAQSDAEGGGIASAGQGADGGSDPLESANLNLSKSNINSTTTGDPDFDLNAAKQKAEPGPKSQ